jgi:hypothetical protein
VPEDDMLLWVRGWERGFDGPARMFLITMTTSLGCDGGGGGGGGDVLID